MQRICCCAWLWLGVAPPLPAATVELPAELTGAPGSFVKIVARTDCPQLRWLALDRGLNLFPSELLRDSRTAVAVAMTPGRYRVLAYGARGDAASEPAVCTVVIGAAPEPTPPPEDPLTRKLRQAFREEAAADKAEQLAALVRFYRAAAAEEVQDTEIATLGALLPRLLERRRRGLPDDALLGVRRILEGELAAQLPAGPETPLDVPLRIRIAQLFHGIARRLEALP